MGRGDDEYVADWPAVFSEIGYAHESQYPPRRYVGQDGKVAISFHKLSIYSDGSMEYKGQWTKFDTSCWWKVEMIYKLFEEGGALETLYGQASS